MVQGLKLGLKASAEQFGPRDLVELGVMCGGDVARRRPQLAHPVGRQAVVDPRAVTPRCHQPGGRQCAQVERRVRHALADLGGELVDVPLALREHVDQLGAAPVGERLGDLGKGVEQRILGNAVTHRSPPRRCYLTRRC